jgi:transcriptional regulator with XRE-family HTH domain
MNTLDKILYLIKKNGLTELEFTQKAGLNKTAVTEWKKGKTKSYYKHIPNIAAVLKIPANELLEDSLSDNIVATNSTIDQNQNSSTNINKKIILTLEQKKIKLKDFCAAIHISSIATLNTWFLNNSIPSEFLIPICEFLQIDILWLLSDNSSKDLALPTDTPLETDRELILVTEEEKYLIELIRKLTPRQRIKIEGLVEDKVKEYTQGLYPNQTSSDCQIGPNEITATKLA